MEENLNAEKKLLKLKKILSDAGSAVIALSGGTDSIFLAYVASGIENIKIMAVTVNTPYMFDSEVVESIIFCKEHSIRHKEIQMEIPEAVRNNPPDRCYLCKKEVMKMVRGVADKERFKWVFDGTNIDDTADYRPGMKALKELEIRSPLLEAGITKDDIRTLSRNAGLITWNKPSNTCLLTRFPHNTPVTIAGLRRAEAAELVLETFELKGSRIRVHDDIARIECRKEHFSMIVSEKIRNEIVAGLKKIGYRYITLDLEGYRSGSMNPKESKYE